MIGGPSDVAVELPPPVAGDLALFLDFDGTLVEFASRPDAVMLGADARAALERAAAAMPGRVALVSGRSLAVLAGFLGDDLASRLTLAGSHGAERRAPGGTVEAAAPPPALAAAIAELRAAATNGLLFEEKALGAALHWRQVPHRASAATAAARAVARRHDLTLQLGDMVAEVRAPGDKGDAIAWAMRDPVLAGCTPVMVGDDLTDEAGFAAAARAGGWGVLVGPVRATAAAYRLAGVAATIAWLDRVAAEAEGAAG